MNFLSATTNLAFGRVRRALLFGVVLSVGIFAVGCPSTSEELDPEDSITVGLLLPFTGSSAGTAANFERSVILAAERINDAGGIQGKSLRIVARDTHSTEDRSDRSVDELVEEGSVVIIGPESPEIADTIRDKLNAAKVPLVSPLIGAGRDSAIDCDFPWYRLAPSAQSLGESLANDLFKEGLTEIAILYGSGAYNRSFRAAVKEKFESNVLGGSVIIERELDEGVSSYADEIRDVIAADPQAIVLSTSPQTGAIAFTEANLIGVRGAEWAFSPLLKTPLFLQNINASDAEGALGIAPKVFELGGDFAQLFAARWLDDEPLEGAYFYYDAVNLLTVAFGLLESVEDIEYEALTAAIVRASSARGVSVGWDEMEAGLERMADGVDVNYSGLTGPILLQACGNRRSGITEPWTVVDEEIVGGAR